MTKDFPTSDLREMVYGDGPEDCAVISDEITDTGRWSVHHTVVFQQGEKFYTAHYSVGATENQDERPFEYDGLVLALTEVVPVEKTVTVYVPA